ncbi:uncharacterized protein BDZ99DRAFT_515981 [Mytilinidion resinicola]|uniref:Uncharacterized protein n=1 Tax=Mytilinidion resinicola TaxID=574789 RepID=A0A6A6Z3D2_9PEZI|nr:uncharacterized protein BDZ99DRAFT_515981 [Mytilinidion resinicola]KAF2815239.1 hypothetical protein BDZ99DRAFT_515981 [Mytilinidion resinicola]
MSLTKWKKPFEGTWVEPERPIVEPMTPERPSVEPLTPPRTISKKKPRADSLTPGGGNRNDDSEGARGRENVRTKNNRARHLQAIAQQALEPHDDVLAAAALHFAEMQAAQDRTQIAVVEFDNLERLRGEVICCCEFLEEPQRIKLHLTNGTRLVISAKSKRADIGVPWQAIYDTEPALKVFPTLADALKGIGGHAQEHHDTSFNGGKRILGFKTTMQASGAIQVRTLSIRLESMFRLSPVRSEAEDEDLYDVVLREDVEDEDS